MAYAIRPRDTSLRAALRRIAADELSDAMDALTAPSPHTLHDRIHDARKSCKKLRALARLVRPGFPHYSQVNAALRDAARPMSRLRDAAVFVETFDALAASAPDRIDGQRLDPLRAALIHARPDDPADIAEAVEAFRARLAAIAATIEDWTLKGKDARILQSGLETGFAQAHAAMKAAVKRPDPERMHNFRKRVKVHWYHARLLSPAWPEMIGPHRDIAGQLGEALGLHHDLVALDARLDRGDLPETSVRLIRPLMQERMAQLECDAFATARLLLSEPPEALAERWTRWWRIASG